MKFTFFLIIMLTLFDNNNTKINNKTLKIVYGNVFNFSCGFLRIWVRLVMMHAATSAAAAAHHTTRPGRRTAGTATVVVRVPHDQRAALHGVPVHAVDRRVGLRNAREVHERDLAAARVLRAGAVEAVDAPEGAEQAVHLALLHRRRDARDVHRRRVFTGGALRSAHHAAATADRLAVAAELLLVVLVMVVVPLRGRGHVAHGLVDVNRGRRDAEAVVGEAHAERLAGQELHDPHGVVGRVEARVAHLHAASAHRAGTVVEPRRHEAAREAEHERELAGRCVEREPLHHDRAAGSTATTATTTHHAAATAARERRRPTGSNGVEVHGTAATAARGTVPTAGAEVARAASVAAPGAVWGTATTTTTSAVVAVAGGLRMGTPLVLVALRRVAAFGTVAATGAVVPGVVVVVLVVAAVVVVASAALLVGRRCVGWGLGEIFDIHFVTDFLKKSQ
eukprot:PhM_4_TR19082/c0_g1_i1/m.96435